MASQHKGITQIKLLGSNLLRNIVVRTGEEVIDTRRNLTGVNPVITICTLHKIQGKDYEM
jgi:hypothetical protein